MVVKTTNPVFYAPPPFVNPGSTTGNIEVFILGEQELIRRERRDGGQGEERGLRKGAERG